MNRFHHESLDADARHGDLAEQVWRSYCTGRVVSQLVLEFRVAESTLEMRGRLPHGVVQKDTTPRDASVKLGRDVAGLVRRQLS